MSDWLLSIFKDPDKKDLEKIANGVPILSQLFPDVYFGGSIEWDIWRHHIITLAQNTLKKMNTGWNYERKACTWEIINDIARAYEALSPNRMERPPYLEFIEQYKKRYSQGFKKYNDPFPVNHVPRDIKPLTWVLNTVYKPTYLTSAEVYTPVFVYYAYLPFWYETLLAGVQKYWDFKVP